MRARPAWLIFFLVLLHTYAAQACGEWSLDDEERGHTVSFYIRSTFYLAKPPREPEKSRTDRILLMEGMSAEQLHTEVGGRTQLAVVDNKLQLLGKTVGALRGDELTIGRITYQISVKRNPALAADSEERIGRWLVEVRRNDQRIASGRAMAMCLGGPQLKEDALQELEVRRRVTFYLAWRQLLAGGHSPSPKPLSVAPTQ